MASRWENIVAGAGSVKSSAGTYTACTDVTEPLSVLAILSSRAPSSFASVGWYPTADGIRPSIADTSLPACTKRKILSINSRTSCRFSSRRYSASVSPVSAARIREPGGSFICPKTSIVLSITPEARISLISSFPSRLRSPTPAKTEYPPWLVAML